MRVFVSCELIGHRIPASLIAALRDDGWEVHHSVDNVIEPEADVYSPEVTAAIRGAHAVVTVVVEDFGSTWQAIESEVAVKAGVPLFCWNPEDGNIPLGTRRYAQNLLPREVARAVVELRRAVAA